MPGTFNFLELYLTNIGYILSLLITIGTGIFVFLKDPDRKAGKLFLCYTLSYGIFHISHIAGINASTPELARAIFLANANNVFIVLFVTHWMITATGEALRLRKLVVALYTTGFALIALFISFPDAYIKGAAPLLYFPNYYVIGPLYTLQVIFMIIGATIMSTVAFRAYQKASDYRTKKRMFYFFLIPIIGYPIGMSPILPLYGIMFDPLISILSWTWMVPLAYGIIKEDLLDIRIIAKRALIYLVLVLATTVILTVINGTNIFLLQTYPGFSPWIVPALSSIIGVAIALFVWRKVRESDLLKYEFVNVVTHKFRAPMTHIKFSLDEIRDTQDETARQQALARIETANNHLVELTNMLVETSKNDTATYLYQLETIHFNVLLDDLLSAYEKEAEIRGLKFIRHYSKGALPVTVDLKRMRSALQILLENAILYSKRDGKITLATEQKGKKLIFSISDEGIGISKEALPLIFGKFFRTNKAISLDTEGLGIGLFIAKNIVERHGGKMWAQSPGEDKGSTFFISLKPDDSAKN